MKVICIDDGKIKQSERSFNNCSYQTDKGSSLTIGKTYTIYMCKRPEPEKVWVKVRGMDEYYFDIDDTYFNETKDTWVALYNDDGEQEWYYLSRFVTTDKFRDKKLNELL